MRHGGEGGGAARPWIRALLAPALVLALALPAAFAPAAVAKPPPWAPAHGYRAKHGAEPLRVYAPRDFDIHLGRCNRELIGAVLGGAVGGVLGAQVGKGSGRVVASAAGTIIGVLVGGAIGRGMDAADQTCIAQALEAAADRQGVVWHNPDAGTGYRLVPLRTSAGEPRCRTYRIEQSGPHGPRRSETATACRDADGSWHAS